MRLPDQEFPDPEDFTQGAAAVRKVEGDDEFNARTRWLYTEEVTLAVDGIEGGQFVDANDSTLCLGYSDLLNYEDNGVPVTRA